MALNAAGVSGVPRYTAALAAALDRVSGDFPELELTLVATSAGVDAVVPQALRVHRIDTFRSRTNSSPIRQVAEQIAAPFVPADVMHYFDVAGPLVAPRRPFTLTFHDAAICHPEYCSFGVLQRAYRKLMYPWSLARARAVVAVSEFAKEEAIRYFRVKPEAIVVIHSGPGLTPIISQAAPSETRPYVLFVGSLTAGKNVPFLIRAFGRSGADADLVLAGKPIEAVSTIESMVRASERRDSTHIILNPSDAELDRLYRGALAVALPSFYEGFGFTPLEAMSRGRPVLASDIPAVREVSGTGALLLPLDVEAWAEGIRRVVGDPALRADLAARGRRTVERYSWERTARSVCEVFLKVAG
jgi:glycosyltransferase involved in cell wall biosynthesis